MFPRTSCPKTPVRRRTKPEWTVQLSKNEKSDWCQVSVRLMSRNSCKNAFSQRHINLTSGPHMNSASKKFLPHSSDICVRLNVEQKSSRNQMKVKEKCTCLLCFTRSNAHTELTSSKLNLDRFLEYYHQCHVEELGNQGDLQGAPQ